MSEATGVLGLHFYTSATPMVDVAGSADAIGDFTGLTIASEIGLIENFGELGRVFESVKFQELATGRTFKLKGGYDDGTVQLTVGQDLSDTGQALLKSYADASNQNTYPFKATILGANASYDTVYFGAKVLSFKTITGATNSVLKAQITLDINTTIFTGAS